MYNTIKMHQASSYITVVTLQPSTVGTQHTHTHTRLMALFWDYPGEPVPER